MLSGKDMMSEPLVKGELLEKQVLRKLSEPIRHAPVLEASLKDLVHSVKAQGLGEPGPPPAVALTTSGAPIFSAGSAVRPKVLNLSMSRTRA